MCFFSLQPFPLMFVTNCCICPLTCFTFYTMLHRVTVTTCLCLYTGGRGRGWWRLGIKTSCRWLCSSLVCKNTTEFEENAPAACYDAAMKSLLTQSRRGKNVRAAAGPTCRPCVRQACRPPSLMASDVCSSAAAKATTGARYCSGGRRMTEVVLSLRSVCPRRRCQETCREDIHPPDGGERLRDRHRQQMRSEHDELKRFACINWKPHSTQWRYNKWELTQRTFNSFVARESTSTIYAIFPVQDDSIQNLLRIWIQFSG